MKAALITCVDGDEEEADVAADDDDAVDDDADDKLHHMTLLKRAFLDVLLASC